MRSARLLPSVIPLVVGGVVQAQPAPAPPEPAQPAPAPAPDGPGGEPAPGTAAAAESTDVPAEPAAAAKPPERPPAEDGKSKFVVVDDSEPEPPIIPLARDTLAGHFTLGAGAGLAVPFGKLSSGVAESDVLNPSLLLSLDAAFGVSRYVAVGAYGQYLPYTTDGDCLDCEARGFAVGAFVRYHLVQGTRFDPWALAGLGYRKTTIESPDPGLDGDYSGIDWLHLQVGGDWYPFSVLGFGPYLGLDVGVYGDHPQSSRDSSPHWQFSSGLRLLLDVPGK